MSTVMNAIDAICKRRMNDAMYRAVIVAKANCPVDTGSLQESIESEIGWNNNNVVGVIRAGGQDFTGVTMSATGREGKYVDYAADQEAKHNFLKSTKLVIESALHGRF